MYNVERSKMGKIGFGLFKVLEKGHKNYKIDHVNMYCMCCAANVVSSNDVTLSITDQDTFLHHGLSYAGDGLPVSQ